MVDRGRHFDDHAGDACDYAFVKQTVFKDAQQFNLKSLAVDRLFQGQQLAGELLEEGIPVTSMGQGFLSFAAPMVEFFRRLTGRQIHHGGHPILRWMAGNLVVRSDPAGNMKPDKARSRAKIDGIVALVMALDGLIQAPPPAEPAFQMFFIGSR